MEVRRWASRRDLVSGAIWACRLMIFWDGVHERKRTWALENWGKVSLIFEMGFALPLAVLKRMVGRD